MMKQTLLLLLMLAGSSFAWWDASFAYRAPVNITNAGSALTDYQVNISINTQALVSAGKMRADCGDLRTIASDDSTQLPYWIETECNSTATKIWVKIPAIAPGANTIRIYYGNPSATYNNTLGGNSTFALFDDFSGDLSKWSLTGSNAIEAGALKIGGDGNWETNGAASAATTPIGNIIEFKLKYTSGVIGAWGYSVYPLNIWGKGISFLGQYTGSYIREVRDASPADLTSATTSGSFIPARITLKSGQGYALFYNGILQKNDTTWTNPNSANRVVFEQVHAGYSYIDDVRVRKYAETEPASAPGAEEETARQFTYRQAITISNDGSSLTDYQINLTINTATLVAAGKMRSDCADIRFTNSSSYNSGDWAASYPYWIESGCNSTATKIWVKAPSIPAGTSTIYAYHGNASAASASSGTNTFVFFDDFSGDLSKWTETDSGSNVGIVGNELNIIGTSTWNQNGVSSTQSFARPVIMEWKTYGTSASGHYTLMGYGAHPLSTSQGLRIYHVEAGWWSHVEDIETNLGVATSTSQSNPDNLTLIIKPTSGFRIYINNALKQDASTNTRDNARFTAITYAGNSFIDDIRVRKYASPEPTATEQPPDTTPPALSIQSPTNSATYTTSTVPVSFTATDDSGISSCAVKLNGTINSSTCLNYTLTLANGAYTLNVTANDTSGNMNSSQASFTVAVSGGGGQQSNATQATTDNNGIADGNVTFSFTPNTLAISAGTQGLYQKTIRASAGVTKIGLKARLTLKGQAATGKQVTYTISE